MTRDLARRDSSRGETPPDKRLLARQETPLELAFSVNHFFFGEAFRIKYFIS